MLLTHEMVLKFDDCKKQSECDDPKSNAGLSKNLNLSLSAMQGALKICVPNPVSLFPRCKKILETHGQSMGKIQRKSTAVTCSDM